MLSRCLFLPSRLFIAGPADKCMTTRALLRESSDCVPQVPTRKASESDGKPHLGLARGRLGSGGPRTPGRLLACVEATHRGPGRMKSIRSAPRNSPDGKGVNARRSGARSLSRPGAIWRCPSAVNPAVPALREGIGTALLGVRLQRQLACHARADRLASWALRNQPQWRRKRWKALPGGRPLRSSSAR